MANIKEVADADVNNLVALCHIIDDYDEFNANLTVLLASMRNNQEIPYLLDRISHSDFVLGAKKVKQFYRDNKLVVDTVNNYSNINAFISSDYDWYGNVRIGQGLDYFYRYIISHYDDLEKIRTLITKIKKLGFDRLQLDENADFTNNDYYLRSSRMENNADITFFENMELIPNYNKGKVGYRTTGSDYKINIQYPYDELSRYSRSIVVTNLLFDPQRLPDDLSKNSIFDPIVSLKTNQQERCNSLRNAVDLSISVDDLYAKFDLISNITQRINDAKSKEELYQILKLFKTYLEQLKTVSAEYNNNVVNNDADITTELLEEEKALCLKRRIWDEMDTQ